MLRISRPRIATCMILCTLGITAALVIFQPTASTYFHHKAQVTSTSMTDLYHLAASNLVKHSKHSYGRESLTRLATTLDFDRHTCPTSYLTGTPVGFNIKPEHSDECPTVFIVGARKGGTTSLYQYLSKHPDFTGINLDQGPKAGETMFFQRNRWNWSAYRSLFPTDGTMSGDSSVGNLVKCEAPRRIFTACGRKAKVVMLLRNPTNRFVSNYLMRARLGTQTINSSNEAIHDEIEAFSREVMEADVSIHDYTKCWDRLSCLYAPAKNMVFEGLYYTHVMNWLCNFPLDNVLIANSEEFFENPTQILREVFDFVGLKRLDEAMLNSIASAVYNEGSYNVSVSLKISNLDRERLAELYKGYNEPLLELLNWKGKVNWN